MNLLLALVVGVLYASALYLMTRRSLVKLIMGLALLGHASNVLIFVAGGITRGRPPLVPAGAEVLAPPYVDPVPQALILTAIVIGFGVLAFTLVLVRRTNEVMTTDDMDRMRTTDQ